MGERRRPAHARSAEVHEFLRHLGSVGFAGAPAPVRIDGDVEVLEFVEGFVPDELPYDLSDEQLRAAAALVRAFHDAGASAALRGGHETVAHGDLGPHNMVFRDGRPVAIIDFDQDVRGGSRLVDWAHAVWCLADVTEPAVPVAEQARRVALLCDAYPGMTPAEVIGELGARFRRAHAEHAGAGRDGAVAIFADLIAWLDRHAAELSGQRPPSRVE